METKKPFNFYLGLYLLWVFINMVFWMIAEKRESSIDYFFPFGGDLSYPKKFQLDYVYDWSELLFYSISPPIIYFAYNLISDAYENHRSGNDE